ncbi:hypothetical protein D9M69_412690 [compost metagenome]
MSLVLEFPKQAKRALMLAPVPCQARKRDMAAHQEVAQPQVARQRQIHGQDAFGLFRLAGLI